jgi:hypothetical protein
MGTVIVVLLLVAAVALVWKMVQAPDKNGDGKVDAQDVVIAAKEVAADAKAGGEKVVEKVKKARKKKAE